MNWMRICFLLCLLAAWVGFWVAQSTVFPAAMGWELKSKQEETVGKVLDPDFLVPKEDLKIRVSDAKVGDSGWVNAVLLDVDVKSRAYIIKLGIFKIYHTKEEFLENELSSSYPIWVEFREKGVVVKIPRDIYTKDPTRYKWKIDVKDYSVEYKNYDWVVPVIEFGFLEE